MDGANFEHPRWPPDNSQSLMPDALGSVRASIGHHATARNILGQRGILPSDMSESDIFSSRREVLELVVLWITS
jgi:hypothetical protein